MTLPTTCILALELDDLRPLFPTDAPELADFTAHLESLTNAVNAVRNTARLPAQVTVRVSWQACATDIKYYEQNPDRSYGMRPIVPEEALVGFYSDSPPRYVITRRVHPGARLLSGVWIAADAPAATVQRFESPSNFRRLDNDGMLRQIFEASCLRPGLTIDIRKMHELAGGFGADAKASRFIPPERSS
jgi:hypothetical protein